MNNKLLTGKGIVLLIATALICMLCGVTAFAATVPNLPDLDATGSISITMVDPTTKEAVPGGDLNLFKVGVAHVEDGNYSWALSDEFAGAGADLSDLEDENLTATLVDYAVRTAVEPVQTVIIDENGKAKFAELPVALYMITQTNSALGYKTVMPFLVSLPMGNNKDGWTYDVDASPKVEIEAGTPTPTPTSTPTPTPTVTPTPPITVTPTPPTTTTPKPTVTPGKTITPKITITPRSTITPRATITPRTGVTTTVKSTLPKTGQLWWPVPILAVVGIVFIFVGLRKRSK